MASLYIFVLLIGLVYHQPIWCQQCDVVVISQAAIKEEIRDEVANVINKVSFNGNVSACNAEQLAERLCDLIDAKLKSTKEIISSMKEEIELYHQPGMTPSHPADSCADRYSPLHPGLSIRLLLG